MSDEEGKNQDLAIDRKRKARTRGVNKAKKAKNTESKF
jgi:hypothetical protein